MSVRENAGAEVSLVALLCRTADRGAASGRGVETLAPLIGERLGTAARTIGSPSAGQAAWSDDLRSSRGCLLEAGGQVEDALSGGRAPILVAGDCSIGLSTLPTLARVRPEAKVLWLDAHGDFNTPATTTSGYLGGMALAGACGLWSPGFGEPIAPERVVLAGVRELESSERRLLERSGVTVIGASLETLVATQNALDRTAVHVHLDFDVIDPDDFPAEFPAPGGLAPDKLYDMLEAVAAECDLVGVELCSFWAPHERRRRDAAAQTALGAIEPLLDGVGRGARVSH